MLTINYKKYCCALETLDKTLETTVAFGGGGRLSVLLVSSGRCGIRGEETAFTAQAGFFMLAGTGFAVSPFDAPHVAGLVLGGQAAEELAAQVQTPLLLDTACCPAVPELVHRIVAGEKNMPPEMQSAAAYTLVCSLCGANAAVRRFPPLVAAAITQMHENFAEVYGIEELAQGLGVTKSHLVRVFNAAVGMPPGRYLTGVRIEAVKQLLLHRAYPLEVVASLCGFSGANYLCKVFKKETGITPAAWRLKNAPQTSMAYESEWEQRMFL